MTFRVAFALLTCGALVVSGCAAIATQQSGSTNDWTMQQMQQAAQMANDQAVQNANNVNNAMLIQQQALLSLMPIQMATP